VWYWLKAHGGDGRLPAAGALSRCSSLSSINTSSGIDVESPSDTASLSAHHLIRRYICRVYRAMLYSRERRVATLVWSVCPSVMLRYPGHIC